MSPTSGIPNQSSKTVLITGANSGVGFESALALASRGARVILACRNPVKGARALRETTKASSGPEPQAVQLDLADMGSVRSCANQLVAAGERVDMLMLNAGVMAMPRSRTADGFEIHFGTNHLGHFALAGLLMPCLLASDAPRIVTTASLAHWWGRMRWRDPNWTAKFYSATLAYGQSKLANLLFMRELDRRVRAAGLPLLSVAAHPGGAHTKLANHHENAVVGATYDLMRKLTQPASQGVLPLLHAATAPVAGGSYWGPDGFCELRGLPAPAFVSRAAQNQTDARRLWELSEDLTGVTWSHWLSGHRVHRSPSALAALGA